MNKIMLTSAAIPHKTSETSFWSSVVSVHHKWNGARLLSSEVESTK